MLKQRIIINIRAMELRIIMMLILIAIMWRRWNHREAVNSKNLLENSIKIITIRQNCIIREKSGCLNILAESCKGGELSQDLFPHWCDFFLADSSSILALLRTFRKSEVFARILEIVSDNSIHFYVIGECQLFMSSNILTFNSLHHHICMTLSENFNLNSIVLNRFHITENGGRVFTNLIGCQDKEQRPIPYDTKLTLQKKV